MNPDTDTPRTDACPHCGAGIYALLGLGDETTYWQCGSNPVAEGGVSRSPECYEKELSVSKAEVERLRNELSDWDYGTRAKREQERAERAEAEVVALRTMAIELVKELIAKCDDPIHREQLASLTEANSL